MIRPHSCPSPSFTSPLETIGVLAATLGRSLLPALAALMLLTTSGRAQRSTDPEKWLREAEDAYGGINTYTAVFHKQQRVAGKLLQEETILIKFRKPFSLYMRWIAAPYKGSELLYVEGWNGNRAKAHRGGLLRFITFNLDSTNPRLMAGNLRPLTDTGLGYLVKTVALNVRKANTAGELRLFGRGEDTVCGRKTTVREMVFPKD